MKAQPRITDDLTRNHYLFMYLILSDVLRTHKRSVAESVQLKNGVTILSRRDNVGHDARVPRLLRGERVTNVDGCHFVSLSTLRPRWTREDERPLQP